MCANSWHSVSGNFHGFLRCQTKDEIVKFINGVIEPETETQLKCIDSHPRAQNQHTSATWWLRFNLALFSSSGVTVRRLDLTWVLTPKPRCWQTSLTVCQTWCPQFQNKADPKKLHCNYVYCRWPQKQSKAASFWALFKIVFILHHASPRKGLADSIKPLGCTKMNWPGCYQDTGRAYCNNCP